MGEEVPRVVVLAAPLVDYATVLVGAATFVGMTLCPEGLVGVVVNGLTCAVKSNERYSSD